MNITAHEISYQKTNMWSTAKYRMRDLINIVETPSQINENYLEHGHLKIPYWKNPSTDVLILRLFKTRDKELRGIIDGNDIYWWEAALGTHYGIAKLLGIEYINENRLHVRDHDGYEVRLDFCDDWGFDKISAHPQFQRILSSGEILIYGGSYGWISYDEYRAIVAENK
jgi:hypothetical protein